jgi:type VI secretion system secreted protein Hcp
MAYEFYATIEGTKQGKFQGESPRKDHAGKFVGLKFEYEVISPRDVATGMPSGKRQHKPIVISKEWGAASPQLFTACVRNEILKKVKFEFIKTDKAGKEHVYYTIELENATIAAYKPFTRQEEGAKHEAEYDTQEMEDITFTFEKITLSNTDAKTSASDSWIE